MLAGFGTTPSHVKSVLEAGADGAIVGSALIKRVRRTLRINPMNAEVFELRKSLKQQPDNRPLRRTLHYLTEVKVSCPFSPRTEKAQTLYIPSVSRKSSCPGQPLPSWVMYRPCTGAPKSQSYRKEQENQSLASRLPASASLPSLSCHGR